jgi:hypothetical protein
VSTDLRANLDLQYGIAGTKALDRVAGTGVLDFILENSSSNSAGLAGYYSPAHANVRSGFTLGIPVRLRFVYSGTTYYKFRGTITGIRPVPGIHGARATMVKAADWMNLAAQTMASTIDTQVNVNSTDVVRAVMDIADRTPAAVSIATGSDTFPFALDNSRGESMSIMQEFTRYSVSEFGYVYLKGDTTQGGVLTIESRARRQLLASPVTTFSDTMQDMELEYDEDSIINSVFVMIYPRQVGTPATVLYTLQQHQDIENGTTLTLRGQYVDPLQRASRVGAIDLVTPVAYTDYTFNDDSSGDGTDFTPYLVVTARSGGNDFEAKLTNNHPSKKGHLLTFQIRGTPLYDYDRFIVTQRDEDSIRQYGERPLTVEMVYQTSAEFAKSVANYLISLSSRAPAVVSSLTLMANTSAARLADILTLEVGDRIGLAETQTGLTTASGSQARNYFINQISLHAWDRGLMRATYTLSSGNQLAAWELGTVGASELDQTTVLGL